MACIFTIWGDADGLVCPNVQTVPPSAGYLKRPPSLFQEAAKGPAPGLKSRFVVSGLLRHEDQKPQRALRCLAQYLNR
jgi:hypothetical protein